MLMLIIAFPVLLMIVLQSSPWPKIRKPPRQQQDPNVAMGRYTFGRLHLLLRGDAGGVEGAIQGSKQTFLNIDELGENLFMGKLLVGRF
jgi:hypothetical protein